MGEVLKDSFTGSSSSTHSAYIRFGWTAGSSYDLDRIDLSMASGGSTSISISVLDSSFSTLGTSGSVSPSPGLVTFTFSTPISITSGSVYYVHLYNPAFCYWAMAFTGGANYYYSSDGSSWFLGSGNQGYLQTYAQGVINLSIPAGSLTITGQSPAIINGLILEIPAGALEITGQAPSLTLSLGIPHGTLTITGQRPRLSMGLNVPHGSLTITGKAPSLLNMPPIARWSRVRVW